MIKRFDKSIVPQLTDEHFAIPKSTSDTSDILVPKTSRKLTRVGAMLAENANPSCKLDQTKGKRESRKELRSLKVKKKVQRKQEKGRIHGAFKRRLWTKEEDEAITSLVKQHGIRKWTFISKKLQEKYHIYGRYGKQCRER